MFEEHLRNFYRIPKYLEIKLLIVITQKILKTLRLFEGELTFIASLITKIANIFIFLGLFFLRKYKYFKGEICKHIFYLLIIIFTILKIFELIYFFLIILLENSKNGAIDKWNWAHYINDNYPWYRYHDLVSVFVHSSNRLALQKFYLYYFIKISNRIYVHL